MRYNYWNKIGRLIVAEKHIALPVSILFLTASIGLSCSKNSGNSGDKRDPPFEPPIHECGTIAKAVANQDCFLALTEEKTQYIEAKGNIDYWVIDVPSPLASRSILVANAKYRQRSVVILEMSLLKADGKTLVDTAKDARRWSASGEADLVHIAAPIHEPGRYFLKVQHDSDDEEEKLDRKIPYSITVRVESDSDVNEPNDKLGESTPITMPACNNTIEKVGFLSTKGDRDYFELDISSLCSGNRSILYLETKGPTANPVGIRLNYQLKDSQERVVAESASSAVVDQLVATARLAEKGTYYLVISAYQSPNENTVPPGDPSFQYTVKIGLFEDDETVNGNDTITKASLVTVNNNTATIEGKLPFVGDQDFYAIPKSSNSARLVRYQLTYSTNSAVRFPKIPSTALRQLSVVSKKPTKENCQQTCPQGGGNEYGGAWCENTTVPQCLWQKRTEQQSVDTNSNTIISTYRNFIGQFYVPANEEYFVQVGYTGGNGADDQTYSLELDFSPADEPQPDSQEYPGITVNATTSIQTINLGWGFDGTGWGPENPKPNEVGNVRVTNDTTGIADYDSSADTDYIRYNIPANLQNSANGVSLSIGWSFPNVSRSYDLRFRFMFCKADNTCITLPADSESNRHFAYRSDTMWPWYEENRNADNDIQIYSYEIDNSSGKMNFTYSKKECMCIDSEYAQGGRFYLIADAYARHSYDNQPVDFQVNLKAYPDTDPDANCPNIPCQWISKRR